LNIFIFNLQLGSICLISAHLGEAKLTNRSHAADAAVTRHKVANCQSALILYTYRSTTMIDNHYHVVEKTGTSPERHTRIVIRLNRRRLSISPDSLSEDPKLADSTRTRTSDIWHINGSSDIHMTNGNTKPLSARDCRRAGAGRAGRRKPSRVLRSSNHCMMLPTETNSADEVMEDEDEDSSRVRSNSVGLSGSKILRYVL